MKEMKEKVKEPSKSVLKNLRESILIILEISYHQIFTVNFKSINDYPYVKVSFRVLAKEKRFH